MPTKEDFDAMSDAELLKYANTLPQAYSGDWSRDLKDIYNAAQRRDYKKKKEGKRFYFGSSSSTDLSNNITPDMNKEKAKKILLGAFKYKIAKSKLEGERYERDRDIMFREIAIMFPNTWST